MRKLVALWICVLLLAAGLFRAAQAALNGSTYLPLVFHDPTHTPTPTRTPTVTPTATATQDEIDIEIYNVVSPGTINEYVELRNDGNRAVDLTEWKLTVKVDEAKTRPQFIFPEFTLNAGRHVKIHTRSGTDSSTDLYMNRSDALWPAENDCIILRNDESPSKKVDERCYP